MTLTGTRFGAIDFEPDDILDFADGIVGFEGERRFILIAPAKESPFRWLQSLANPSLAFLLADPSEFIPTYDPELPGTASSRLGLGPHDAYLLWTTATVPPGNLRAMTLNLAAPIVVNPTNGSGRQIVLDEDRYSVRTPAFPAGNTQVADEGGAQRIAIRAA